MYFKIILPVAFTSHFKKKKKILKSESAKRTSVDFIVSGELCQVQTSGACFSRSPCCKGGPTRFLTSMHSVFAVGGQGGGAPERTEGVAG